jgi:hypothetical protein
MKYIIHDVPINNWYHVIKIKSSPNINVVIVCLLKPPTNPEHELHWLLMTTSTNLTLAKTNVNHDELKVFIWLKNKI